jgi:hypothetical protein
MIHVLSLCVVPGDRLVSLTLCHLLFYLFYYLLILFYFVASKGPRVPPLLSLYDKEFPLSEARGSKRQIWICECLILVPTVTSGIGTFFYEADPERYHLLEL